MWFTGIFKWSIIASNLHIILISIVFVSVIYGIHYSLKKGFEQQGRDPERNDLVRFIVKCIVAVGMVVIFYLIFEQQQEKYGLILKPLSYIV